MDNICSIIKLSEWLKDRKNNLYNLITIKLFECYHSFLSMNVKTYLKFDELREIIRFLREDSNKCKNLKEELTLRLYDDSVVKIISKILLPEEEKSDSIVQWIDNVMMKNSTENVIYTEVVIEKEIVERKDERIKRIINKYSRNKSNMDKSPPINDNAQIKIMNARDYL